MLRVYLPKAGFEFFLDPICFFVKLFGSSEPRVPDNGASSAFRLLSIPGGQLAQSQMASFHDVTPDISLCSAEYGNGFYTTP